MLVDYVVAKYIRLSLDDKNTGSMSISSQQKILDSYIANMDEAHTSVLEFVDNGFSGTNYERPGVQELLALVQTGKVNCIVVKDFSRFGRSAIETGYFIERVFPLFQVRFIAVDDNYDSADHMGDTGGIDVAFRFLIHEQYSRDLSKKIKTAKQDRARRGELVMKSCLYGYRLDENRKMVIDPVAADVVRLMFTMYSEGISLTAIREHIYEQSILTPALYKRTKRSEQIKEDAKCAWGASVILNILRDERYTGTYVAGKTKIMDVGSTKQLKIPENEWIKIPNHHPAIVSTELFNKVQAMLRDKGASINKRILNTSTRYADSAISSLKGVVVCGHCGHAMQLPKSKNASFQCKFGNVSSEMTCYRLKVLTYELERKVFSQLTERAKLIADVEQSHTSSLSASESTSQVGEFENEYRVLYEKFLAKELDATTYKAQNTVLGGKIVKARQVRKARLATAERGAGIEVILREIFATKTLTQELSDMLIEKVFVHSNGDIAISWKNPVFRDFLQDKEKAKEHLA